MFRSSPGRSPPRPHSPHPRPSGAFPFRRGPPAFGPGPPKPCGRGPQLPTAALRRGRGAFRLLRPESPRRKTKGTPPPFRTAFSSASSSPPRPKGRCPLRTPPLTADRIPPAARSGSSACAAPRTSSGAGRGCARSFRTPHPPAVPLPTFGAPHPGARKHRISGEALRQRRRRKTLQRY